MCMHFNCMQFGKFMWHNSVGYGYVTVCSTERMKNLSSIVWPDMDDRGRYMAHQQCTDCMDCTIIKFFLFRKMNRS
jgi:hypothetical protein